MKVSSNILFDGMSIKFLPLAFKFQTCRQFKASAKFSPLFALLGGHEAGRGELGGNKGGGTQMTVVSAISEIIA